MVSSSMTVQQAVALARQHHQAGQLSVAESLYREVLAAEPEQADAMHWLGVLAFQSGQVDVAVNLLRDAARINSASASTFADLGRVLTSIGRRDEAVSAYRNAVRAQPRSAETHILLANALLCLNVLDEAVNEYHRAIELKRDFAEAYNNLGQALRNQGKHDEAQAAFQAALKINPRLADAHYNLGLSLKQLGQVKEASAEFQSAVKCRAEYPEAWNNLGSVLLEQDQIQESVEAFRKALSYRRAFPESLTNLGNALRASGQIEQSISSISEALVLRPEYPCALNSLGSSLHSAGRLNEAIAAYRKAIALRPEWEVPHCNLAFSMLLNGQFTEGWVEHEWRLKSPCLDGKQSFDLPFWDGSNLDGRTIVLHTEQGFGDAIQFCRYIPMVARKGGRVLVRCQPELVCLMKSFAGVEQVITSDDPLPADVELHSPLLSLPKLFKTELETIPADVPYISARLDHPAPWRSDFRDASRQLKVGIVWAGRRTHIHDRERSLPLTSFSPLTQIDGVTLVSLQKGEAASQAGAMLLNSNNKLLDCSKYLRTFADTAALINDLDLVISVDSAVAHLAGAMGKLVWVLLPFAADWRWMLNRSDSPWYPTMRLFRQAVRGDWKTPISQLTSALRTFASGA